MSYATTQQALTYTIEVLFILGLWIVVNGMVDCIIESWRAANMPAKIEVQKVEEDLTEMTVEELVNGAIDSGLIDKEINPETVLESPETILEAIENVLKVKKVAMKKADYIKALSELGLPTDGTVKVLKTRYMMA